MELTDKYTRTEGKAYLTGIQALVRLPIDQMRLDRRAGLQTAALISGYEGSPLGGYDLALGKEQKLLSQLDIHHWPAVNEDLGATAIYGSQMVENMGPTRADGVAGIWYGKGPGVDRSGDIFRHANLAGTSRLGCALVLAGDDHASKSSTIPHQSDFSLMNWGMPVLAPGNTQEILDLGLAGLAMSRYSGAWVGLKLVTNVCDGGATIDLDLERHKFTIPDQYQKKNETRMLAPWTIAAEHELFGPRLDAAKRFAAANRLNRFEGAKKATFGIATAGKAYYDLLQAIDDAGLTGQLEALGIRIAKFGMTFPVENQFAREFANGLETILVIEEKRAFLETQLRDVLYDLPVRPKIIGKQDSAGETLVPNYNELDPDMIATILERVFTQAGLAKRVQELVRPTTGTLAPVRLPNFCSGCPHNRSTILLPGQAAGGGTGCHGMGILMPGTARGYEYATQMGGEGVPWIGIAPFSQREHVFQNLGDGTYFHSGSLAVQACVAAKVNITFKLLYNGHVAMTGGQAPSNVLPVPELTRKLEAEGVKKIVVLVEDTKVYSGQRLAKNAVVRDRVELESTMAELPKIAGVTVLIYDQECAAEKRRSRSRGKTAEPTKRLIIHEEICEGCGDCVTQSNCMSLQPVETPLGEKMRIHQSSCNKDYTCALGDCPSFVFVQIAPGTGLPQLRLPSLTHDEVAEPKQLATVGPRGYRILSPGIGGTGVITINALLATAATLDGYSVSTLDQTGLAQKGGAVVSHLTLSKQEWRGAGRINTGNADLILGFDALGVVAPENLKCAEPTRTVAVVNTTVTPTSESIRKRLPMPGPQQNVDTVAKVTRRDRNVYVDATRIAETLFSSHLAVNVFLLGVAWQAGLVPLTLKSIETAIQLNGVEVDRNLEALLWGRLYYTDSARVEAVVKPPKPAPGPVDYYAKLVAYQSKAYANLWKDFVDAQPEGMRASVGRYLYKVMAYKDEYEVARLLTASSFQAEVDSSFTTPLWHGYVLHPPVLRALGWKKKLNLGPWAAPWMKVLAMFKVVRGGPLDVFAYAKHRREERDLIIWVRAWVEECAENWRPETEAPILDLLGCIDQIRGYGDIKSESIVRVKKMVQERYELFTGRRATAKSLG